VVASFGNQVKYLRQQNGGKATAINAGMEIVSGDFILVMDDDDLLPPDAIQNHLSALLSNRDADFSYGRFSRFSGASDTAPLSKDLEDVDVTDTRRLAVRLLERCFLTNPTWMARRSALERVGPYSTTLLRGQDYDIILRLARHNSGVFVNHVVLWQRVHMGPRGPVAERVTTTATIDSWIRYGRQIVERIDDIWLDADFAPLEGAPSDREAQSLRLAVLERATLLFVQKCYDRSLTHFERYRAMLGSDTPSRDEVFAAAVLLGNRYTIDDLLTDEGRAVLRRLSALHFPYSLRTAFIRQLRWRVRDLVRDRQWAKALRYVLMARRAFGVGALAALPVARAGRGRS
jgi:glycosyltransferase involved in cell wall biosynthesis